MNRKQGEKDCKNEILGSEEAKEEATSGSSEENSDSAEVNGEKGGTEPKGKPTKVESVAKVGNLRADGVVVRPPPTVVYGRVKVKLKASKPPVVDQQQVLVSDGPAVRTDHANVDNGEGKGGSAAVGMAVGVEKGENENSLSSLLAEKRSGSVKIVSLKGLSPKLGRESGVDERREELGREGGGRRYNEHELEASLEVIKKAMKMDAAEPFNVPVDPIKLGIPDYFDVIDTPMDFGTIRSNLESGAKYMDSEDVYKDVQYIWENCYKYNNKGDYIVDLMKRVKKNFMKYWMAAGLFTELTKKTTGGEDIAMNEATTSGLGKKLKRGRGGKRHKDDCMCAICIMKRRRREREAREAHEGREAGSAVASLQGEVTLMGIPQGYKQEDNLRAESPHGEDTSSYMETSPEVGADAEMEEAEEIGFELRAPKYVDEQKAEDRVEFCDKPDRSGDILEKLQRSDKGELESYSHIEAKVLDETGIRTKIDAQKQLSTQPEGQTEGLLQQRQEFFELEKKRQRLRLIETFCDLENPMLSGLCGSLFPSNHQSVWNGANSLPRRQRLCPRSDIHEAVASFMSPSCKSTSSGK